MQRGDLETIGKAFHDFHSTDSVSLSVPYSAVFLGGCWFFDKCSEEKNCCAAEEFGWGEEGAL